MSTTVVDYHGSSEFAEATHAERWSRLLEQYPDGRRLELWIDRDRAELPSFLSVTNNKLTKHYAAPLAVLLGYYKVAPNLINGKLIRIRSTGCPKVTYEMDRLYSLSYGSAQGILRLKVGTLNRNSKSNFLTSILLTDPQGQPYYDSDENIIVTSMPCKPLGSLSATLVDLASHAAERGVPYVGDAHP